MQMYDGHNTNRKPQNMNTVLPTTLQQEFGNQGLDESAYDYKTRNSFLTAGELLSVRYSHAHRLLHICTVLQIRS